MGAKFWVKRAAIAGAISFSVIFIAQYIKSNNIRYALTQSVLWGAFTAAIYLLVLWRKLKKNPSCALKQEEEKQ
jgi:hypothetical protein